MDPLPDTDNIILRFFFRVIICSLDIDVNL